MPTPDPEAIRHIVQDIAIERRADHDRRASPGRRAEDAEAATEDARVRAICEAVAVLVAAQLEEALARACLSRAEAAIRAGASPTTLVRILKAQDVRLSTLVRLADTAGCDLEVSFRPRPDELQHIDTNML